MKKVLRKIIEIDEALCDGCGECIKGCAENALKIVDGKAKVVSDKYCDGLGACIGVCPTGALKIVEKETEEFVGTLIDSQEGSERKTGKIFRCPASVSGMTNHINWPLKIMLSNPNAGFFKKADIVIGADCCSVVYPCFYTEFVRGRVVITGCPKFDGYENLKNRLVEIFSNAEIKKINCVIMDVPCCSGLLAAVNRAKEEACRDFNIEVFIIDRDGKLKN